MNPILKNILAVIAGAVIGSIVNIFLVNIGPMVIAPPEGADVTTMEGLEATMHLFEPRHFIFPFLAHALGTLVGALIAAAIAANRKQTYAIVIGVFFLAGGTANVFMLPTPSWFIALDLIFAYIPVGWLGFKLYEKIS
jgi:hypothetical protein